MSFRNWIGRLFTDDAPAVLKAGYLRTVLLSKAGLRKLGLLSRLDQWARVSRHGHYLRSLLAIYQLDDMIQLDVPWWTYPAIDRVAERLKLLDSASVLEYGSGASTIWLARRGARVVSIEHDRAWYSELNGYLGSHPDLAGQVALHLHPPQPSHAGEIRSTRLPGSDFSSYVLSPRQINQTFDLIIIDGRCRPECLNFSRSLLRPGGWIVFDNSERARYQESILESGLNCLRLPGSVPGSPFRGETAILST